MEEIKLLIYWSILFFKICFGMKIEKKFNFIVIYMNVMFFFFLIVDSKYCVILLGCNMWKGLIGL